MKLTVRPKIIIPGGGLLASDDWSRYNTDSELLKAYDGQAGSKGSGPQLVGKMVLVPDAMFGKAMKARFTKQAPFYDLAIWKDGRPGDVVRVSIPLPTAPKGIWVRFRFRFVWDAVNQPYGWVTKSPNDPSPFGGSYKVFFMHWSPPFSERGSLVYTNTRRLDFEYYITGLTKTERLLGSSLVDSGMNRSGAPEFTNGGWMEAVYLTRTIAPTVTEAGMWVRQLTPVLQPWEWVLRETTFSQPVPTVRNLEFGGNKNHGNEFDQWIVWGPWQVYDATQAVNPFGVPLP